jgi:NAD(P)-dependent dehydrogenase (short-subunit alcohol dehydrogenase family)
MRLAMPADFPRLRIFTRTPLRRIGGPEKVASIVVFLACADSSYISGQTIYAHGSRLGRAM